MKTSEEIKKGLMCGSSFCNIACPYWNDDSCTIKVNEDALAYIQQLEAEKGELKRERDALFAIVKGYDDCEHCKHGCPPEKEKYLFNFCEDCDIENCRCRVCTTKNNCWELRGPCEENGGN